MRPPFGHTTGTHLTRSAYAIYRRHMIARETEPLSRWVAGEIRAEMARQQITQEQLAEEARISRTALTNRLNGKSNFRAEDIFAIAGALGFRASEIMRRAEESQRRDLDREAA